jgi:hypothetical protein
MEVVGCPKMLVTTYETIWYYNRKDHNLNFQKKIITFRMSVLSVLYEMWKLSFWQVREYSVSWQQIRGVSEWDAVVEETCWAWTRSCRDSSLSHFKPKWISLHFQRLLFLFRELIVCLIFQERDADIVLNYSCFQRNFVRKMWVSFFWLYP